MGLTLVQREKHAEVNARWYEKNKERERYKARKKKKSHRAYGLFNAARTRAKRKSLDFTISLEWVESKLALGKCEVTNLSYELKLEGRGPWHPSIDRTDSSKGYTPDNCKLVCWLYNSAKSEFNHTDVMILVKALHDQEAYGK